MKLLRFLSSMFVAMLLPYGYAFGTPKDSSIVISVNVEIDEIERQLQEGFPQHLADLSRGRQVCIPAQWLKWDYPCFRSWKIYRCQGKTKISPDIRCDIVGWVRRDGALSVRGDRDKIVISLPVHARVSAKDVGGIIASVTAEAKAIVTAEATLGVAEDWEPHFNIDLDFVWSERPTMRLFDLIEITFASEVKPYIRRHMSAMERTIAQTALAKMDIRGVVQRAWTALHQPIILGYDPRISLLWSPRSVGFSDLVVADDVVQLLLRVDGSSAVYVGDNIPEPVVMPLPDLSLLQGSDDGRFHLRLPVFLDIGDIAEPSVVQYLSGVSLSLDVEKRLVVADLPVVDDRFRVVVTYDFSEDMEWVDALANERYVLDLRNAGTIVAEVYDVKIQDWVEADEDGMKVEVEVAGSVRLDATVGWSK